MMYRAMSKQDYDTSFQLKAIQQAAFTAENEKKLNAIESPSQIPRAATEINLLGNSNAAAFKDMLRSQGSDDDHSFGGGHNMSRQISATGNPDSPDDQLRISLIKENIRKQYINEAENSVMRFDNLQGN